MDTVLAENGIAMVLAGHHVKAVPVAQANQESPADFSALAVASRLRLVHDADRAVEETAASELVPVLMPFCKAPNAILPLDSPGQLILRDYSSNIRKMLKLVEDLENNASR